MVDGHLLNAINYMRDVIYRHVTNDHVSSGGYLFKLIEKRDELVAEAAQRGLEVVYSPPPNPRDFKNVPLERRTARQPFKPQIHTRVERDI